jgi:hypothetical protein
MSEVKVNKISPRTNCGTVQLGDSGDTITIPAGATITNNGTQTGFGRTGTVDWDTTAKTAGFTAVSGTGYFVNTTSGAVTMTLPASPSAGDIVSVKDYAYTFETNNLTVNRNGSPIGGGSDTNTIVYSTNGDFLTFIYVDATQGWVLTNDSTNTDSTGAAYITATGGTIVCCGDFKTHIFTSPGTFCVSAVGNPAGSDTVEYLVVAGGGGAGGYGTDGTKVQGAGGGGGGGWRSFTAHPGAAPTNGPAALPVTVQGYPVTVGSGGAGTVSPNSVTGSRGANSVFSTITSTGGGGGGSKNAPAPGSSTGGCKAGGSGGGGAGRTLPQTRDSGGAGNTPPVSPPQGNPGGCGARRAASPEFQSGAGGGGGASGAGNTAPTCSQPGKGGGTGQYVPDAFIGPTAPSYGCSPAPQAPNGRFFAGGGGGGAGGGGTGGDPGPGGGGRGGDNGACNADGVANTGGGAGGPFDQNTVRNGGSGIVMIRYKYQ